MNIIFEHPINEHVRSLLRIEKLFAELDRILRFGEDKNTALMLMVALIRLLERPDLKSKLTNSLNQQYLQLQSYANNPNIEQKKLAELLYKIESKLKLLRGQHSLQSLMPGSHPLLKKYQTEMLSHGATALIVDPSFCAWDLMPEIQAAKLLNHWRLELEQLCLIVQLSLDLMRQGQDFKTYACTGGFFSQSINFDYSLIRIRLPAGIVPEVSAGRHRVVVRFKDIDINHKTEKVRDLSVKEIDIAYCI